MIARLSEQADHHDAEGADANVHAAGAAVDDDVLTRLLADVKRYEAMAAKLDAADAAALAAEQAAYDALQATRDAYEQAHGAKPRGQPPKPPGDVPKQTAREHLTDPDSQLMKTRDGIMPAYNAQAGVDVDTQLIVTSGVTDAPTDYGQIVPTLHALEVLPTVEPAAAAVDADDEDGRMNLLADAGYYSDDNVQACEEADVNAYIATGKNGRAKRPKGACSQAVETMVARMQGRGRPGPVSQAQEHGRNDIRLHQGRDGISVSEDAWSRRRSNRVAARVSGVERQTLVQFR